MQTKANKDQGSICVHGCETELLAIVDWSTTPVTDGNVIYLSPTLGNRSSALDDPMSLFVAKLDVRQKQRVVRTNLNETISVVRPIGWDKILPPMSRHIFAKHPFGH